MKNAPPVTLCDLPLSELHTRVRRAIDVLREARECFAGRPAVHGDRTSSFRTVDEAVEAIARLLPGLVAPPRTLLSRTLADLTPQERTALRRAIDAEQAARERLVQLIGDVPAPEVKDALARVELREWIAAELSALWRAAGTDRVSPRC